MGPTAYASLICLLATWLVWGRPPCLTVAMPRDVDLFASRYCKESFLPSCTAAWQSCGQPACLEPAMACFSDMFAMSDGSLKRDWRELTARVQN